jgi:hypothetical protein
MPPLGIGAERPTGPAPATRLPPAAATVLDRGVYQRTWVAKLAIEAQPA